MGVTKIETQLDTPVAFVIFNRPAQSARVFEAIAKARPRVLLVIGDGARKDVVGEVEKVAKCREMLELVDWPCEVMTNFADTNLGCRTRVSTGLDWTFSKVDEAIILEDDCLPSQDFFKFASGMLGRFRSDERVGSISGSSPTLSPGTQGESYYFSSFPDVWGWATWARVWNRYNSSIPNWPDIRASGLLEDVLKTKRAISFWRDSLDDVHAGRIDTWDYQLSLLHWTEKYLAVIPHQNLITNIGFGPSATHTLSSSSPLANLDTETLDDPILHPLTINRDLRRDQEIEILKFSKPLLILFLTKVYNYFPEFIKQIVRKGFIKVFR